MKREIAEDAAAFPDRLLAQMPIAPREGFAGRVCAAVAEDAFAGLLAARPIEASADFTDRVMAAIGAPADTAAGDNTAAFPRPARTLRFLRFAAAATATAAAVCFALFPAVRSEKMSLSEQVAAAVEADPELEQLAAVEADLSFDEFVAASQLLKALNDNSAETEDFFAYYEN